MNINAVFTVPAVLYCAAYLVYCIKNRRGRAAVGAAVLTLVSAAAALIML